MSVWYYLNGFEIIVGLSVFAKPEATLEVQSKREVTEVLVFAQRRWALTLIGFGVASVATAHHPDHSEGKTLIGLGWLFYHIGIVVLYANKAKPWTDKAKNAIAFHLSMTLGFLYYFGSQIFFNEYFFAAIGL